MGLVNSPICPNYRSPVETTKHLLAKCSALDNERHIYFEWLDELAYRKFATDQCTNLFAQVESG